MSPLASAQASSPGPKPSCWQPSLHMYQLLAPRTHSLTVAASTAMYTLSPQTEPFPQDTVRKEFNKKTGHTVMIRSRARPDKSTNQQPIHTRPDLFISLFLYFPTLTPPHITRISLDFPWLWFLPYTSHSKPQVKQHRLVTRVTTKPQLKRRAWISFLTSLTRPSRDTQGHRLP